MSVKSVPIQVWPFHDAPDHLKELSPHCGDEDWLALVPPSITYVPWLEDYCRLFGACDTSEHILDNGSRVYIGAHA